MILDDFDARPGSATSLLRSIIGVSLRRIGGWLSVADLIRLMDAVGVGATAARTAVSRVKAKGLLLPRAAGGKPGYALNPDAIPMLERGDRRIFNFRQMADGDPWCLLSFSIPEAHRAVRHQLRKRLGWIGCGTVTTGLWICPAFLTDEVAEIVADLGLRNEATLFVTETPRTAGSLAEAAGRWWDLTALEALHRAFLAGQSGPQREEPGAPPGAGGSPRASFTRFIQALDEWRILPYVDPGLPPSALPPHWPGFASVALFGQITAEHEPGAQQFLLEVCSRD